MRSIKFIFVLAIAAISVSCLKTSPSNLTYTSTCDLEYALASPEAFTDSLHKAAVIVADPSVGMVGLLSYYIDNDWESGWILSLKAGTLDKDGTPSLYASAGSGAGADKSRAYLVFYDNQDSNRRAQRDINFAFGTTIERSCIINFCHIDNTAALVDLAERQLLQPGDFLKVTFSFYDDDNLVATTEKYLLDNTGAELKMVTNWEELKFENVPTTVNGVKIRVETSREEIPPYFCLDNFNAKISMIY